MKWKKFTLTTTTEAVDLVSSMLDDVGIEGIEVEDNVPLTEKETKGMFKMCIRDRMLAVLCDEYGCMEAYEALSQDLSLIHI